ncbi:coiled-coil domain-containing 22 family protein [Priestia aryabhattai]|uniref:hypothetical protein n=1 Tax=Priestia aryabhattai TaxID=412384 RepID=UPI0018750DF8|nr:hypothetical protein [Priestia aryabhattai]MBE5102225.1 hypothetical protein [Priestia aryabhattai]
MYLFVTTQKLTNDELVKQMQEKVISMQDKQISFLNDTISNTYTAVGIVVTLLGIIATVIFTWISVAHNRAKKKMDVAEEKLNLATEKIDHAQSLINKAEETIKTLEVYRNEVNIYRTDTKQKVQELSSMIDNKMKDLKEIESKANNLVINHNARILLVEIEGTLENASFRMARMTQLYGFNPEQENLEYEKLKERQDELTKKCQGYSFQLERVGLDEMYKFHQKCLDLKTNCRKHMEEVEQFIERLQKVEYQKVTKYN